MERQKSLADLADEYKQILDDIDPDQQVDLRNAFFTGVLAVVSELAEASARGGAVATAELLNSYAIECEEIYREYIAPLDPYFIAEPAERES